MRNSDLPEYASDRASLLISKRRFLASLGGAAALWGLGGAARVAVSEDQMWDVIIVGGGTAGLPLAVFAAKRGAKVLIIEAAPALGGTLIMTGGMMSAAGTKLQRSKGIKDSPQTHYDDVMRMSRGTADPDIVRLAVFNAAETFDWLTDNGMVVPDEYPIYGPPEHDAYSVARYARGVDKGISVLRICQEKLQPYITSGAVVAMVSTSATGVVQDSSGRVTGVRTRNDEGAVATYSGRNVVLTSGGFTANYNFVYEYDRVIKYSQITNPFSQGGGVLLAKQAGGYMRGGEKYLPGFASVLESDQYPSRGVGGVRHMPADRTLWEILVNVHGERFMREDSDTFYAYEDALAKQPDMQCWVVFDEAILRESPPVLKSRRGPSWDTERIRKALDSHQNMFYKGATLEELAVNAGIGKDGLVNAVAKYNAGLAQGKDEFGRKYMPKLIAAPPFYAIRAHGTSLLSFAGVAVDQELRVVRPDGKAIHGLYAAGEILGAGQLMGRYYCGGMSFTPAVTFGRLLGQKMLDL